MLKYISVKEDEVGGDLGSGDIKHQLGGIIGVEVPLSELFFLLALPPFSKIFS